MKKSLLLLVAAAPFLAACGADSESESDLEDNTKEQLISELGEGTVDKVDCPDDLKAEEDETMSCTATVAGEELKLKLTVTSVKDGTAEWTIDLDE